VGSLACARVLIKIRRARTRGLRILRDYGIRTRRLVRDCLSARYERLSVGRQAELDVLQRNDGTEFSEAFSKAEPLYGDIRQSLLERERKRIRLHVCIKCSDVTIIYGQVYTISRLWANLAYRMK